MAELCLIDGNKLWQLYELSVEQVLCMKTRASTWRTHLAKRTPADDTHRLAWHALAVPRKHIISQRLQLLPNLGCGVRSAWTIVLAPFADTPPACQAGPGIVVAEHHELGMLQIRNLQQMRIVTLRATVARASRAWDAPSGRCALGELRHWLADCEDNKLYSEQVHGMSRPRCRDSVVWLGAPETRGRSSPRRCLPQR